jgi:ComF family protein
MVDGLAALLAPARCALCERRSAQGLICGDCAGALPWNRPCCPRCAQPQAHDTLCADCAQNPPVFDTAFCPLRMAVPVVRSVHGLKYAAGFLHADLLGALMAQELARRADPLPQRLIPVPLHPRRLVARGYNQALELARRIARRMQIELAPHAAKRIRLTEDQIGKSAAQRRRNVRGAFAVTQSLDGQHVALLDDVMTTGATLGELARMCRKAGAARVEVWAAARVE